MAMSGNCMPIITTCIPWDKSIKKEIPIKEEVSKARRKHAV
jgi:hypothetical protein